MVTRFKIFLVLGGILIFASAFIGAAGAAEVLEPPIITSFNKNISNNEIFFVGGRATVPDATVLIYLQHEAGSISIFETKTDAKGEWFYTHPEFLRSGKYALWTQLKADGAVSPPGPQTQFEVIQTAIQIGGKRISYEALYGFLTLIVLIIVLILSGISGWHFAQHRRKSLKLNQEIREAEQSVRRGFALLKRDLQSELETIHKLKATKELTADMRAKEAKILKDLDLIEQYIGKEIADIEEAE